MWQEILVVIIGLFTVGYVILKVIKIFTRKDSSPCSGCSVGCALKDTKEALTENCEKKRT
jgi:hypothetical protein